MLIILTNIITFGLTNIISIKYKDKVVLSANEYNQLISTYKKYSKLASLEDYIKENYLYMNR